MTADGTRRLLSTLLIATGLATLTASPASYAIPISLLPEELPQAPVTFKGSAAKDVAADPQLLEALKHLNTGDVDRAIAQIRTYLDEHPASAAAFELLGAALAISGKTDQALIELRRAIQINPQQSTAYTKIGDIYAALGQFDDARQEFEKASQINPSDRLNYQRLGYLEERAGNTQEAISYYERGVQGMPLEIVGVKLRLASLYNKTGVYSKAAALLEPIVSMEHKDPAAHLVLGSSYLGLGRTDEAIARFKKSRALKGDVARVSLALGIAYREQGNLEASLNELDKVIETAPDWSTGYYQKGETANAMQRHEDALTAYRQAEKLSAKPALVRLRIADTLTIVGRYEEATTIYSSLLADTDQASPAYLSLLNTLASTYRDQGKLEQAESTYRRMIEAYPKSGYGYNQLGSFYGYLQRYNNAIKEYERGLSVVPDDAHLIKGLSLAYSRRGDHKLAAETAARLVELNPDNVNTIVYAATLQEDAGNLAEADRGYTAALRKDDKNVLALNNLAMLRSNNNDFATALELANRARKLAPDNAMVLDTYGWIQYHKGNAAEASPVLKQAVELAPQSPTIHYHLGVVSQVLNDIRTAKKSFAKALSLSDDFTEADDAKARLDSLGG